MKKLIALMMAMLMLFSCAALAEETAEMDATIETALTETEIEALESQDVLDFDIVMDKLPEGLVMTKEVVDHIVYAVFAPEEIDESTTTYTVSVGYSEKFEGQTLNGELTADQMLQALEALTVGYNNPIVKMLETDYGTTVFFVQETEADSAYAELTTVYNGYVINMFFLNPTELTEEDVQTGMQIISDLWIK